MRSLMLGKEAAKLELLVEIFSDRGCAIESMQQSFITLTVLVKCTARKYSPANGRAR